MNARPGCFGSTVLSLFLACVLTILLVAAAACGPPLSQTVPPPAPSEAQRQELVRLKELELSKLYEELKKNIEEAEYIATRLGNYNWYKFGSYFVWVGPYQVNMIDLLPASRDVEPVEEQLASLKGTMHRIWKERPYLVQYTNMGRLENLPPAEWKNLSTTLKNDLIDVRNSVLQLKAAKADQMDKVLEFIAGSNLSHMIYSDMVEGRREYLAIADKLIQTIDKAVLNTSELEQWDI